MKTLLTTVIALTFFAQVPAHAFGKKKPAPAPVPAPTATPTPTPTSTPTPTPVPTQSPIAGEPAFCNPNTFYAKEFSINDDGLERAHAFQIGALKVVGLAVGGSGRQQMVNLAQQLGGAGAAQKYCTWYLNDGEEAYTRFFNWQYMDFPDGSISNMVPIWERDFKPVLTDRTNSFLECAERNRYVAFGCDGQAHRGPTAMAMLLGFVGCTPQHAREIAVHYWGQNGITNAMREAIAKRGNELGAADPQARQRFLNLMLAQ